ncbi:hypothetical protein WICPIJ_003267 [Wickerhamomyces pijperi]|uniref:Uncharacterized protein n=1 Tax=Wickerhamomyces pijperi TaxID=599730 RepID=A0A9P8Q7M3_WICPI|nr:hypothetical protein WICPIJ_003267 [Wickerhamomyces pijperi]
MSVSISMVISTRSGLRNEPQRQTNGTVSRHFFKDNTPDIETVILVLLDLCTFSNANDKHTQSKKPHIERQLLTQMGTNVRSGVLVIGLVFLRLLKNTQGLIFPAWTAGCNLERSREPKPAVLEEKAKNIPLRTLWPAESPSRAAAWISKTIKRIQSAPLNTTSVSNNHHVVVEGKRIVKQRLGWSNKNPRDSLINDRSRELLNITQMMNLSTIGNPVLPQTMKKAVANKASGSSHLGVQLRSAADVVKVSFKPVKSHAAHDGVDEDDRSKPSRTVENDLLVQRKEVQVNGV